MLKKFSLLTLVVLALVLGVVIAQAADPTPIPQPQPNFTDGRLNAFDPGAPIVIYETRATVPTLNNVGLPSLANVVNGVQVLRWDGATQSASLALGLSADAIQKAIDDHKGTSDFTIATRNGVSLHYAPQSNQLFVMS